ncbi:hypothetical protein D9M68_724080 [compost metagenome]
MPTRSPRKLRLGRSGRATACRRSVALPMNARLPYPRQAASMPSCCAAVSLSAKWAGAPLSPGRRGEAWRRSQSRVVSVPTSSSTTRSCPTRQRLSQEAWRGWLLLPCSTLHRARRSASERRRSETLEQRTSPKVAGRPVLNTSFSPAMAGRALLRLSRLSFRRAVAAVSRL